MRYVGVLVLCACVSGAPAAHGQVLQNGQFVGPYNYIDYHTAVAPGWTHFRLSENPEFKQSDFEQMPGGPAGQVSCQQIWSDGVMFEAGLYQRVSGATVGQTYRATGWLLSVYKHGIISIPPDTYQDGYIHQLIGIDPYGGTDPTSPNVVWSWDDLLDRRWRELVVDAAAQSSTITVFARVRNTYPATNCLSFYDAFDLAVSNPVSITNVLVRPGPTEAVVTWTTDVPATSKVEYLQYRGFEKSSVSVSDPDLKTQHSITITGLSEYTQYYCKIVSTASGRDDGVDGGHLFRTATGQQFATLLQARNNPDGTKVYVRDLVVTAGNAQSTSYFFVEQQDRLSGMRVDKGFLTANLGATVDISGTLATTADGERKLTGATVLQVASGSGLSPLALGGKAVGGSDLDAYNPGVTGGTGPYNIGTLVTVWGRITAADSTPTERYFYIDDGSGLEDGTVPGRKGLRVSWRLMLGTAAPVVGSYAIVTGPVSCFKVDGSTHPQILLRSPADLRQL